MLLPLLNAVLYAGLAIGIGAVVARFLLLSRCGLPVPERVPPLRLAATAGAFAAAAVLLAAPARIALQLAMLTEPGEPWTPMLRVILVDTGLGRAMQLQAIWGAAALMAFTVARTGRDRGWKAAAVAILVLAVTVATLHVIAAGAWVGTLFHLWRSVQLVSEATVGAMLRAFHPVALGSAGILAATGAYQSWTALGGAGDLLLTSWGRLLVAKVLLVIVVAALGHRHWKTAEGRLAGGERTALAASFARELLFAAVVIAITAVLASSAPPV